MSSRYIDRQKYFNEQEYTTRKYILPFIGVIPGCSVLEIGCGEGGNLKPFLDLGCKVTGVDISSGKILNASIFFSKHINRYKLTLIFGDVLKTPLRKYDLIILKDTIEHIKESGVLWDKIKQLLKPSGRVFISFPPWAGPFAGHQQMCKFKLPYIHLLPFYPGLLRLFEKQKAGALLDIKECRLTINRFKKIISGFEIGKEVRFLINPSYDAKFGLKPVSSRLTPEFLMTTYYCLIS